MWAMKIWGAPAIRMNAAWLVRIIGMLASTSPSRNFFTSAPAEKNFSDPLRTNTARASEGQLVVAVVDLVDPGHTGVDLACRTVDQTRVVGPDRGAESVRSVIGARDRVVEVAEAHDWKYGPEHLFGHQPGHVAGLRDDRRLQEVALVVAGGAATDQQLAPRRHAVLELLEQLIAPGPCVDRAHPELPFLRLDGSV